MTDYIIDSYAWIEYLIGSNKGKVLKNLFSEQKNNFFTVECCLAEIKGWSLKNNEDFENIFKIIKSNSEILKIIEQDRIMAAEEKFEQRKTQKDFGLIDAVIVIKQKQLNCKVISGDSHFRLIKNSLFMKE